LINAAKKGHTKIVELLLAVDGVAVNAKNKDGETALNWAAKGRVWSCVCVCLCEESMSETKIYGRSERNREGI
jgi:hypothetical protein